MRKLTAACLVAVLAIAFSPRSYADTHLAIICATAAAEGRLVSSGACQWGAQSYNVPTGSQLVRTDPRATIGGTAPSWTSETFTWKRWDQMAAGELYEVCGSDVPRGTTVLKICTTWFFVVKAGTPPPPPPPPPEQRRVTVTWTPATQNTDCSPIPAWNSLEPGRLSSTFVQWGELVNGVFTQTSEVRVPMPAATVAFDTLVGVNTAIRAQHLTASGQLGRMSQPVRPGETPVLDTCTPPTPPPVDCVVSAWQLGAATPAICPVSGVQTRVDSRTILTAPANGGLACPELARIETVACTYVPPVPTNPCVLRPFSFSVRTWPGGLTGSRTLAYSSNKAIDQLTLGRSGARVVRVTATDLEGCTQTVAR
jgi:hypothetical protein